MSGKTGLARLLEIAGEKKGLLVAAAALSSLSALLMLLPYLSAYWIIRELLQHAEDPLSADRGAMFLGGATALLGLLAGLGAMYGGGIASHVAAFRIQYGLRLKLSAHIGQLSLGYLKRTSTGAVKHTLDSNVEKVESFIAHQLPDLVQVTVTTLLMIGFMFYLNVWLALACLLPIALAFLAQSLMLRKPGQQDNVKRYYDFLEEMNASAVQYVRGMPAVKVFGQTVRSFRKFHADMMLYRDYCVRFTDQFQNAYVLFKVLLGSFAAFILPVGVFLLDRSSDSLAFSAVLLFFLVLAPGVSAPMFKLLHLAGTLRDINEGVSRIDAILSERPLPEPERPEFPRTYEITFDRVSFSYGGNDRDPVSGQAAEALTQISFTARQGEVTALVGRSGSGKSTVAQLVPRFWDAAEGSVRIGDVDVRQIGRQTRMELVAFVFQETFLFTDTVYHNIAVGRHGASRGEVLGAAQAAQCLEFIERLPQGIDTVVGHGGFRLSGGEEQRIAVARAMLKNAPILVLDEATAFADPENEFAMQLALRELMQGKTVLVIAHRLGSIRHAGRIVVLERGKVAEQGTHDRLIAEGGLYAELWAAYAETRQRRTDKEAKTS